LALRQRDEAQGKAKAGSLAESDVLIHETRLAELDQSVLTAEVLLQEQSVMLANAMGVSTTRFDVAEAKHPTFEIEREATVLTAASSASYAIAQQRIAVEIAQDSLRTVAEATRSRLDALAWLQTQGLGNQAMAPAVDQIGAFKNVSANVGLVFEMPLSPVRHQAQRRAGEFQLDAARSRLSAIEHQVRADTLTQLATLDQAQRGLALAVRTTEVATRAALAQRKRLQIGIAIPIEVQTSEDSLRRAQLSVERARVNATKAQIRLANLTGHLLFQWSADQTPNINRPVPTGGS
jgi:outer membrane protein TolC